MHLNSINLVSSPNLKILVPKEGLKLRLKVMHPTISIVMLINLDRLSSFGIIFMQHLKCSEKKNKKTEIVKQYIYLTMFKDPMHQP
jgi:hypothetical protein